MADPSANYHAIAPSEDHYRSETHEAGVSHYIRSTSEWSSFESTARWTYFLLGCATMLPWNGDLSSLITHLVVDAHVVVQRSPTRRLFSCPE